MFCTNMQPIKDVFVKERKEDNPQKRTLFPMVTATSVLGVKFAGGVIVAADTLGSYGSLARFRSLSRIFKVNDTTVLGIDGDYADFQYLQAVIEQKIIDDECLADGFTYTPKSIFSWLTRVMYGRRSKFNPLWNTVVVAGMQKGEPFLGYVDKVGVAYEAPSVATGYGAYIAQPLLRDTLQVFPDMPEARAREVIGKCQSVLFYRDARSSDEYDIGVVTGDGVVIEKANICSTAWSIAQMVKGYE